jgi:hypothetical protein
MGYPDQMTVASPSCSLAYQSLAEQPLLAKVYGLPLVMSYGIMYEASIDRASGQFKAPINQIKNEARVFTYKDTSAPLPNSDTPYSILFADLRAEPIIISVPDVETGRYYSVMLSDFNTYNYGYIGTRATGNMAGDYMVVGPEWKGETSHLARNAQLWPRRATDRSRRPLERDIRDLERPDEIVLIGGHLDSWDLGTGATDDGAGIAIVFGAARLIAGLPQRPSRTIRVVLFGAEEMNFSGAAYAQAHEGETGKIVVAGEADFGARNVYSVQLPGGAAGSDFGHTIERIIAPLGANVDRRPALGGGDDIRELQKAGVPAVSLRQDGLDYFDTHHTADDTLDKIDPKQLDQAVAVWSAFTYLAAASDVDFRSLAPTAK